MTHATPDNGAASWPAGSRALVANGNYVTKQSAGIYSTTRPEKPMPRDPAVYQGGNHDRGPAVAEHAGAAQIETYAVHDRQGPSYTILFGRLSGRRFINTRRTRRCSAT